MLVLAQGGILFPPFSSDEKKNKKWRSEENAHKDNPDQHILKEVVSASVLFGREKLLKRHSEGGKHEEEPNLEKFPTSSRHSNLFRSIGSFFALFHDGERISSKLDYTSSTVPRLPLTRTLIPFCRSFMTSRTAMTAGNLISRAVTAPWERGPPLSVTSPFAR